MIDQTGHPTRRAVLAGSQISIREQVERGTRCRGLKLVSKVIS